MFSSDKKFRTEITELEEKETNCKERIHERIYQFGKSFGVVIVNGHEIATFRKDIGKGRRPDAVKFTPDIKQDVKKAVDD